MLLAQKATMSTTIKGIGWYIEGTEADDILYGSAYDDTIHGLRGNDRIYAGSGNDSVYGGDGNDTLDGGAGNDRLDGGAGNDTILGGAGSDQNIGGAGYDTLSYAASSVGVSVNLAWNQGIGGDAQGDTYSGIEKIIGSSFNDTLICDSSFGVNFDGGAGNDGLRGGSGLDVLNGGAGDDWLEGGRGIDVLTGGSGRDTFKLNMGDGPDLIVDFARGFDKIALGNGFDAPYQVYGSNEWRGSFGADGQLRSGTNVGEVQYGYGPYATSRDALYFDTDDSQLYQLTYDHYHHAVHAELLATFANGVQLTTSDFIFV